MHTFNLKKDIFYITTFETRTFLSRSDVVVGFHQASPSSSPDPNVLKRRRFRRLRKTLGSGNQNAGFLIFRAQHGPKSDLGTTF